MTSILRQVSAGEPRYGPMTSNDDRARFRPSPAYSLDGDPRLAIFDPAEARMLNEVRELFVQISPLYHEPKEKTLNPDEWREKQRLYGARTFKRIALGFWRRRRIVTLEELSGILVDAGMAKTLEEGKDIIPRLIDAPINYGRLFYGGIYHIEINVLNSHGVPTYVIAKGSGG
jgi:hypothetical protein